MKFFAEIVTTYIHQGLHKYLDIGYLGILIIMESCKGVDTIQEVVKTFVCIRVRVERISYPSEDAQAAW